MKKLLLSAAVLMTTIAASSAGTLDAAEPITRDYSVPVKIEQGYISSSDLASNTRGSDRDTVSSHADNSNHSY